MCKYPISVGRDIIINVENVSKKWSVFAEDRNEFIRAIHILEQYSNG